MAWPEKRGPPTAAQREASKAAKQERAATFAAEQLAVATAARTAAVIKAELDAVRVELGWEQDEEKAATLAAQLEDLEKDYKAKVAEEAAAAASAPPPKVFSREEIELALKPFLQEMQTADDVAEPIRRAEAIEEDNRQRIIALRKRGLETLSDAEKQELRELGQLNASICAAKKDARKAAPIRKERKARKVRFAEALRALKKPEEQLKKGDEIDQTRWEAMGKRAWHKLRAREKVNARRRAANLPLLGSEAAAKAEKPAPLAVPSGGGPSEDAAAAEELNRQMQQLGLGAIAELKERRRSEKAALGEDGKRPISNPFDEGGGDDDDDDDDAAGKGKKKPTFAKKAKKK